MSKEGGKYMIEVAYYFLEVIKFLVIYLLGFSMKITKSRRRVCITCIFTILMVILMKCLKWSIIYPLLYVLFAILLFYLLIEPVIYRNVIIVFWAIGVIFSIDTIGYVGLQASHYQFVQYQDLYASFITIMILVIIFGVISHKQKAALQELSIWYFIAFFVICIVNASVLVLVEKKLMNVHGEFTVVYIMLVLSSLVQMVFVFVLSSSNNWHRKNEELKEQYLAMQTEHYCYLEERNIEIKKFQHDIRAHMYVIKQYIYEKQWNELENYIDTICKNMEYISGYLSVKNEIVDAIVNYYDNQFARKNCIFKVKGNMPQRCCVQAYDLCVIFSNILSNAVESIENSVKREVELSIHFDDDMLYIRGRNTYQGELKRNGDEIITTKSDKESHGFGVQNIKDSVKKYKGNVSIETTDDQFVIDIVMENTEPLERIKKKIRRKA